MSQSIIRKMQILRIVGGLFCLISRYIPHALRVLCVRMDFLHTLSEFVRLALFNQLSCRHSFNAFPKALIHSNQRTFQVYADWQPACINSPMLKSFSFAYLYFAPDSFLLHTCHKPVPGSICVIHIYHDSRIIFHILIPGFITPPIFSAGILHGSSAGCPVITPKFNLPVKAILYMHD